MSPLSTKDSNSLGGGGFAFAPVYGTTVPCIALAEGSGGCAVNINAAAAAWVSQIDAAAEKLRDKVRRGDVGESVTATQTLLATHLDERGGGTSESRQLLQQQRNRRRRRADGTSILYQ